jgi:hypothetical protein
MEDSKSVLVGSPVRQNEPSVPIGPRTQPSEPIGDKNRITSMALKRAVYAGLGREGRSGEGIVAREPAPTLLPPGTHQP